MHRREFLYGTGLALAAIATSTRSQPELKVFRVAFVEAGSASANHHFLDAFAGGLRNLGYVPGKNVIIDVRWAEGRVERFPTLIAEVIALRPNVIVVTSKLGALAAKVATTTIPIVFVGASDPLESGLVATLARPGRNVTGFSLAGEDGTIGKVVEQLKILLPNAHLIGVLWNAANPAGSGNARVRDAEKVIRLLAMTALSFEIRESADLEKIFTAMRAQHVDALVTVTDPLTLSNRDTIVALAAKTRIPTGYEFSEFARAGGLIAYSPQVPVLFERAALYVDKILRGTPPSELPVEQPTKFELVINLKTAKALGLTIPQSLLLRADEVIQ